MALEGDTSLAIDMAMTATGSGSGMAEDEFRQFYALTAGPLKGYLDRVTGDSALADDLLQEAYFRILRVPVDTIEGDAHRKGYLFRIATNLFRDYLRRKKFSPVAMPAHPPAVSGDPAEPPMHVRQILERAEPRDRQLVWLAYVEGASHREIAAITGLKETSIRPMLFRAKQKLAGLLRDAGFRKESR